MKHFVRSELYLTQLIQESEMFQTKVVQKFEKSILCSITFFFFENSFAYRIMWKNNLAAQATNENMAHVHGMLDTYGYKNTFSEYVTIIVL